MSDCPHCPDGHTPFHGGSHPWNVFVTPDRDSDGQPTHLVVMRSAGEHCAQSDADALYELISGGRKLEEWLLRAPEISTEVRRLVRDALFPRGVLGDEAEIRAEALEEAAKMVRVNGRPHLSECPVFIKINPPMDCTCDDHSPEWTL